MTWLKLVKAIPLGILKKHLGIPPRSRVGGGGLYTGLCQRRDEGSAGFCSSHWGNSPVVTLWLPYGKLT